MARLRALKNNFTAGEIDPKASERSDIALYQNGAKYMRNVLPLPQGGFSTRWGFRWINTLSGTGNVKLIEFVFNAEQTYLFAVQAGGARIFRNGAVVANITFTLSNEQVPEITWTQQLDTLILFHRSIKPIKIQRSGSDSSWTVGTWDFINIPLYQFPGATYSNGTDEIQDLGFNSPWADGQTFKLVVGGEESEGIAFTGTEAALANRIQAALRNMPNLSSGVTVESTTGNFTQNLRVTFGGDSGKRPWGTMDWLSVGAPGDVFIAIRMVTRGQYAGEETISNDRGWPGTGAFFQGRGIYGGTAQRPNLFLASRTALSGGVLDLGNRRTLDDYGFLGTPDASDVPEIRAINVGRHVQLFTSSAEYYVPSSDIEPLKPSTFSLRRTTSRGIARGQVIHEIDGVVYFVDITGRALREFVYTDTEAAYTSDSVSINAPHLIRDPYVMALRKGNAFDENDYLFLPSRTDGTMTAFAINRKQQVQAFALWQTDGRFEGAAVDAGRLYVVCRRTINGSPALTIEEAVDGLPVDSAYINMSASGQTSVTGLTHLRGKTVDLIINGRYMGQGSVSSGGAVSLPIAATQSVIIGLPWPAADPYGLGSRWFVETLPDAVNLPDGASAHRKRRLVSGEIMVHDTTGLVINGNRVQFRQMGDPIGVAVPPYTGLKHIKGVLGWSKEATVRLYDTMPATCRVRSLSYGVAF